MELTPPDLVANIEKKYPRCWEMIDQMRENRAKVGDWPSEVYIPLTATWAIVKDHLQRTPTAEEQHEAVLMAALASWRHTKGIYAFEKDLEDDILRNIDLSKTDVSVLKQLPAWAVYLQLTEKVGCFVHLEYSISRRSSFLCIDYFMRGEILPFQIEISEGTVSQMIASWRNSFAERMSLTDLKLNMFMQEPLFALIAYLCKFDVDHSRDNSEIRRYFVSRNGISSL